MERAGRGGDTAEAAAGDAAEDAAAGSGPSGVPLAGAGHRSVRARCCSGAAADCRKLYPPGGGRRGPGGRRLLLERAAPRPVRPGGCPVPHRHLGAVRSPPLSAGTPGTAGALRGSRRAQMYAHPLRLVCIFLMVPWGRCISLIDPLLSCTLPFSLCPRVCRLAYEFGAPSPLGSLLETSVPEGGGTQPHR